MSNQNSHLKTAHDHGVKKALEKLGYASIDDVQKEAETLGLVPGAKTASADVLAQLKAKLG